jgi:hypothetical protein
LHMSKHSCSKLRPMRVSQVLQSICRWPDSLCAGCEQLQAGVRVDVGRHRKVAAGFAQCLRLHCCAVKLRLVPELLAACRGA